MRSPFQSGVTAPATSPDTVDSSGPPSNTSAAAPIAPAPATGEYRPALDGIRAIAVLSVLVYHLEAPWLRGGFLGVDVFFVLSGYLITGLLAAEHAATGRVSLPRFLARRARRLMPALLVLLVAVTVAVKTLRPVTEWLPRAEDLRWALFYGANWHQIANSQDYFAAWESASPLRHLWSIAIEEQFYFVWPLLMMIGFSRWARRWLLPAIVTGAIASAVAMAWLYSPGDPTRAYVGTDTRVQELLIGAALAIAMHRWRDAMRVVTRVRGGLTALGAGGVALALIALPDSSRFYYHGGAFAISLAVAGAIWRVEAMPHGRLARTLGRSPMAWIGRISYGLYLWHWPVILFLPSLLVVYFGGRGMIAVEQPVVLTTLVVAVTFIVTVVSYYALEQPIRHGRLVRRLKPRWVAVAGVAAIYATFVQVNTRLAVPPELLAQVTRSDSSCDYRVPTCVIVQGGPGRPVVALMGDSVARSLVPAFAAIARTYGWTFVSGAHNRCTLVLRKMPGENWEECYAMIPKIQQELLAYKPVLIVASDNWLPVDSYDDKGQKQVRSSPAHVADIERRMVTFSRELTASGARLVLMRYTPESQRASCETPAGANDPGCVVKPDAERYQRYNAMLDHIATSDPAHVRTIDLSDVLCPNNSCTFKVDGIILRPDSLHYSDEGTRWVRPHLERKLTKAGAVFAF